jgi:hypothetical protein
MRERPVGNGFLPLGLPAVGRCFGPGTGVSRPLFVAAGSRETTQVAREAGCVDRTLRGAIPSGPGVDHF